ncbi:MAG: hypothetical protein RH917_02575 [Lacipirellulaceae bacterium]
MKMPFVFTLVGLFLSVGCEAPELPGADVELTAEEKAEVQEQVKEPEPEPLAVDENGVNEGASEFTSKSPQQGRKSREAGGYLGTVSATYFETKHKLFNIQVQNQMRTFNAIHDRYPKDHEEFLKEIIKPIGMPIPELPEGQEAIYDPSDHTLKVQPIQ